MSSHGTGPGLQGPYLDLRTGQGSQVAYARIQGELGFGVIRLAEGPNGALYRMCRELIVYTDLKTGEVLDEWKKPLTKEVVKAARVAKDPFILPWMLMGQAPGMCQYTCFMGTTRDLESAPVSK